MSRALHRRETPEPPLSAARVLAIVSVVCCVFALNFLLTAGTDNHLQLGLGFTVAAVLGGLYFLTHRDAS